MLDEDFLRERLNQFCPDPLFGKEKINERSHEIHMVVEDVGNIDLAKVNYLNYLNNTEIKKSAEDVILKYGVGTCGPRGFYGTTDVHLEMEKCLATFLNMEDSIIYSSGFVAISSSIIAYCQKDDIVFVDEKANFPIRQGVKATQCRVVEISHNSCLDFKKQVRAVVDSSKKFSGLFLVIEGISWSTGKLCPLPEFIAVAEEFKVRIFLDETHTLGIFGESGRGLMEYFDIVSSRIDLIFGTLEGAIGSAAGFCAGNYINIATHHLTGPGFAFSCSLPTYLARVVQKAIELLRDEPRKFAQLTKTFHKFLQEECKFNVESHPEAPFKLISLEPKTDEAKVYDYCKVQGVHFIRNENGLVVNLNVALWNEYEKLDRIFQVLKRASELIGH